MDLYGAFRAEAIEQGVSSADVDTYLADGRPCLRLGRGPGPVAGWVGGLPVLPDGVAWPRADGRDHDVEAEPFPLAVTIDLAALPWEGLREALPFTLPATGLLQLFYLYSQDPLSQRCTGEEEALGFVRVIHVPDPGLAEQRAVPEYAHAEKWPVPVHERVELRAALRIDIPGFDPDYGIEKPGLPADHPHAAVLKDLTLRFLPVGPWWEGVQVGGHAWGEQWECEDVIAAELAPPGEDSSSKARQERKQQVYREWLPLAQFSVQDAKYTNARLMIRREDLAAARFDRLRSYQEFTE
ncbi:DUF1963 domain-containing protein [Streptomyces sp. GESEQ-4]|uniref:DUF1963 domain-containing protein n=1 Tax=Streptomyces sp. GESEQ-4 TaxID=2812655 RepID=UPI0024A62838|nr:DUF1963 domain-containing protein [Streptomyces sp. GESEQ-4]